LAEFSKGATEEITKLVKNFSKDKNFSNIILDLRGNPGGLLQEAIGIAELFTEKGDTLLFTKGRMRGANSVYVSHRNPIVDNNINVATLIDRGSASASEIVSGLTLGVLDPRIYNPSLVFNTFGIDNCSYLFRQR